MAGVRGRSCAAKPPSASACGDASTRAAPGTDRLRHAFLGRALAQDRADDLLQLVRQGLRADGSLSGQALQSIAGTSVLVSLDPLICDPLLSGRPFLKAHTPHPFCGHVVFFALGTDTARRASANLVVGHNKGFCRDAEEFKNASCRGAEFDDTNSLCVFLNDVGMHV